MVFWRTWLSPLSAKPTVAKPPSRPVMRAKSPERLRNEKIILDTRRQILERLDTLGNERAAKETVAEAIDRDTVRAAQVVRRMLLDLEGKDKS